MLAGARAVCSPESRGVELNVTLRSIDRDNWVRTHPPRAQARAGGVHAVEPVHIAEVRGYTEWTLLGVYAGSRMVGFAMYGLDPDDMTVNFIHFMIEGKEQGKGYGKAELEQLLRKIRKDYPDQGIWLSLHPREHGGDKALQRLRFRVPGDRVGDR